MHKRDLKSVYSWAHSIAASSATQKPSKRAKQHEEPDLLPSSSSQDAESLITASINQHQEEDWDIPSDTAIALRMMHSQFPHIDKVSVPPFVLCSQLYSSVKDRTLVDREIEVMKQQVVIRVFKLSTGQDDYAVMYLEDYLGQVKQAKKQLEGKYPPSDLAIFDWFACHILPVHPDVGVTKAHLGSILSDAGQRLEENHLSLLVKAGLLVRQLADDRSYWFAIPHIGFLLKSLAQGREELLSMLNRRQYKEILMSLLEKKKLRMSKLGMQFHIRDLVGAGHLFLTHTPAGVLVRVKRD